MYITICSTSQFRLATFQGFNSHPWLVAMVLDGAALEPKTSNLHSHVQHGAMGADEQAGFRPTANRYTHSHTHTHARSPGGRLFPIPISGT